MNKLEKVKAGLECCIVKDPDSSMHCKDCPYRDPVAYCLNRLKMDALDVINGIGEGPTCGSDYCDVKAKRGNKHE